MHGTCPIRALKSGEQRLLRAPTGLLRISSRAPFIQVRHPIGQLSVGDSQAQSAGSIPVTRSTRKAPGQRPGACLFLGSGRTTAELTQPRTASRTSRTAATPRLLQFDTKSARSVSGPLAVLPSAGECPAARLPLPTSSASPASVSRAGDLVLEPKPSARRTDRGGPRPPGLIRGPPPGFARKDLRCRSGRALVSCRLRTTQSWGRA